LESFKDRITGNPRYLISPSSDTPVTVQVIIDICLVFLLFINELFKKEAFHYNCLHICAKENRFEIATLILDSITNPIFMRKLYINDSNEQIEQRIEHILDLYLNTPEKGLNETPLHFACKFGSFEVTKLLLSYKQCSKTLKNKHKMIPYEVICTKINDKSNLDQIKSLFDECYYVPFYRNCDRFELVIEKPTCVERIKELNDSTSSNNRLLTAYVGPTSPSKVSQ
jgi:ankyrin repeat and LEM domain-containing protein 2